MQRYTINEIRSELEQRRGEEFTDEEFKTLLAGFKDHAERRGTYTRQAINLAIRRGWMSSQMAHFFKSYATQ